MDHRPALSRHLARGALLKSLFGLALGIAGSSLHAAPSAPTESVTLVPGAGTPLIPPTARLERIADGFTWAEGPLWVPEGNFLLFSDVPKNRIHRWSRNAGTRLFLEPSGTAGAVKGLREPGSNGLKRAAAGYLLMADQGNRGIAFLNLATKQKRILIQRFEGKRFNSPNDVVVGPDGGIWFTDPPYGLEGVDASPLKEQPANGVYRLAPSGTVTRVEADLRYPNGIGFSPDGRILYVSNSDPQRAVIMAYDVSRSGSVSNRRVFADMSASAGKLPGLPDGLAVDERGDLFASGPGGIHILSPSGRPLGLIATGAAISNCTFGGPDGRTLFMTSTHAIYALRTNVRGARARRPAILKQGSLQ